MHRWLVLSLVGFAVASLALPVAQAHTTADTDDGRFFITVGSMNEPVTTWSKTGLDLTVQANESGSPGAGIADLQASLVATLVSPSGERLSMDLSPQPDEVGRYSFTEAYYYTEAGQYKLMLVGDIDGTPIDGLYDVSGPVPEYRDHTFPAKAKSPTELETDIKILESRLGTMQQEMGAMQAEIDALRADADTDFPWLAIVPLAVAIAVLMLFLGRKMA